MTARLSVRSSWRCLRLTSTNIRWSSTTTASAPPLLLKLRDDLKGAMKAKDKNRLDVLRGILAETTNQSKSSSKPLSSDAQILSILRKRAKAAEDAAAGFKSAKRMDLTEKEMSQLSVLEEYINGVETVGEEEIRKLAGQVIGQRKLDGLPVTKGNVIKALKGPNGAFGDRIVEMETVAQIVEGMV